LAAFSDFVQTDTSLARKAIKLFQANVNKNTYSRRN
jgi:hypothetical protein